MLGSDALPRHPTTCLYCVPGRSLPPQNSCAALSWIGTEIGGRECGVTVQINQDPANAVGRQGRRSPRRVVPTFQMKSISFASRKLELLSRFRCGRFAHHKFRLNGYLLSVSFRPLDPLQHTLRCDSPHLGERLPNRCKPRNCEFCRLNIVESDDRNVCRYANFRVGKCTNHSNG